MKNQNKILLSLVTASISALASAPYLVKQEVDGGVPEKKDGGLISPVVADNQVANQDEVQDIKKAVEGVLQKKSPVVAIGKNINVVTEHYGKGASIHQEVIAELGAGYDPSSNQDSTTASNPSPYTGSTSVTNTQGQVYMCHSACHGVCHSNCHGARGWR